MTTPRFLYTRATGRESLWCTSKRSVMETFLQYSLNFVVGERNGVAAHAAGALGQGHEFVQISGGDAVGSQARQRQVSDQRAQPAHTIVERCVRRARERARGFGVGGQSWRGRGAGPERVDVGLNDGRQ